MSHQGGLTFDDFSEMYHHYVFDDRIGRHFYTYCSDKNIITYQELQAFFRDEQNDSRATDPQYVSSLVWDFVLQRKNMRGYRDPRAPYLTMPEVSQNLLVSPFYITILFVYSLWTFCSPSATLRLTL